MTRLFISICRVFLISFMLCSCEEIPPVINPLPNEPLLDTTRQNILVEEFTGNRCVNCPAGSTELARLKETYGDQLIIVAIHAGSFARPYPESQNDFQTNSGDALLNYLGQPLGYPSAIINRKLFPDEFDLQLSRSLWPAFLMQEAQKLSRINIISDITYSPLSRNVQLAVEIQKQTTEDAENLRFSVMVVEDNITDYQLTPQGVDTMYNHRHNLRDMLTASTGNAIPSTWANGEILERSFQYTLPEAWQASEVSFIIIIHENGVQKDVWAVEEIDLPV